MAGLIPSTVHEAGDLWQYTGGPAVGQAKAQPRRAEKGRHLQEGASKAW